MECVVSNTETVQAMVVASSSKETPEWLVGLQKAFCSGQERSMAIWPLNDLLAASQLMHLGGQLQVMDLWWGALAHFRWWSFVW
jgi:hypothetical protein